MPPMSRIGPASILVTVKNLKPSPKKRECKILDFVNFDKTNHKGKLVKLLIINMFGHMFSYCQTEIVTGHTHI